MPVICFGPVCVPLNLLLPFLVALLHRYGYFNWFKEEWVTLRFWQAKWQRWRSNKGPETAVDPCEGKKEADKLVLDLNKQPDAADAKGSASAEGLQANSGGNVRKDAVPVMSTDPPVGSQNGLHHREPKALQI